jgi:chromosome segregation ATPase
MIGKNDYDFFRKKGSGMEIADKRRAIFNKTIEENKTKLTSALEERERLEDELKDQKTELKRVETKLKTEMTTLSSKLESTRTDTVVKTIVTKKEQTDYRKLNEKLSTDITYLTQVEEMNEQLIEALNERERLVKKIKKFQNIEIQDFKRDIEIEKEEIKKLQERYFKEKQVLCSLDEINKKLLFSQIDFGESNKTIDINNNIQCGIKKVETIESTNLND